MRRYVMNIHLIIISLSTSHIIYIHYIIYTYIYSEAPSPSLALFPLFARKLWPFTANLFSKLFVSEGEIEIRDPNQKQSFCFVVSFCQDSYLFSPANSRRRSTLIYRFLCSFYLLRERNKQVSFLPFDECDPVSLRRFEYNQSFVLKKI